MNSQHLFGTQCCIQGSGTCWGGKIDGGGDNKIIRRAVFSSRMLLHALLYTDFSHPAKETDQLSDRSGCVYAEMEVIDSSQMGCNELKSTPFPLFAWNCSSVGI